MHDTHDTVATTDRHGNRITRKNLLSSLLIGLVLGIFAGAPVGWFAHQVFARQRAAQVLLCRQQNFGLPEAELQARCGDVY
jgi:Mg/Co/Ni transporter MgtE